MILILLKKKVKKKKKVCVTNFPLIEFVIKIPTAKSGGSWSSSINFLSKSSRTHKRQHDTDVEFYHAHIFSTRPPILSHSIDISLVLPAKLKRDQLFSNNMDFIKMAQNLICTYDKQCRNSNLFKTCLLKLLKQVEAFFFFFCAHSTH